MRNFPALFPLIFLIAAGDAFGAPGKRPKENEAICERYGESLERKFAVNPKHLVTELDELIVRVGSLGPDRVIHNKSGRMLASVTAPSESEVERNRPITREAALQVKVHLKLTEANKVLTQSKRLGFFDEDEERVAGVQEACAKVIFERASILERLTHPQSP